MRPVLAKQAPLRDNDAVTDRSPYRSAKAFSLLTLASLLGWWFGVIALATLARTSVLAIAFWPWTIACVGAVLVLTLRYPRCPDCGTQLYISHKGRFWLVSRPWPSKRCAGCGKDLTAADPI